MSEEEFLSTHATLQESGHNYQQTKRMRLYSPLSKLSDESNNKEQKFLSDQDERIKLQDRPHHYANAEEQQKAIDEAKKRKE